MTRPSRFSSIAAKIAAKQSVTDIQTAGVWHGTAARYEFPASEIAKKGAGGCAVLLQSTGKDGLPGPILGAALIGDQAN